MLDAFNAALTVCCSGKTKNQQPELFFLTHPLLGGSFISFILSQEAKEATAGVVLLHAPALPRRVDLHRRRLLHRLLPSLHSCQVIITITMSIINVIMTRVSAERSFCISACACR